VFKNDTLLSRSSVDDPRWKIVASADMNGDGKNDLIWQHDDGTVASWLMNDTTLVDSVLLSPSGVPPDTWRIAAAGDLNHDGHADLIWQHEDGRLATWLMLGTTMANSILLNPTQVSGGSVWQIKGMADFNQDGRQDLLWQHRDGSLAIWYMDGATMIGSVYLNPSQSPNTWRIVGPK
jgi:serralysin